MARKIWISPDYQKRIVGFTVKVFIPELSKFMDVEMSVADAMEYLTKGFAEVTVDWMQGDGSICKTWANVKKMRNGGQPAIETLGLALVCCVEGYGHEVAKPDGNWFVAIGAVSHEMVTSDGKISVLGRPGGGQGRAIGSYSCRAEFLRNEGGVFTVPRREGSMGQVARDNMRASKGQAIWR